jgi:hypothetical protein
VAQVESSRGVWPAAGTVFTVDRMDSAKRLTGCLSRADANRQWHELAETFRNLRRPEAIARRKYGAGYALYAVPRDAGKGKPR